MSKYVIRERKSEKKILRKGQALCYKHDYNQNCKFLLLMSI